jgi:hypothetical protein
MTGKPLVSLDTESVKILPALPAKYPAMIYMA